MMTPRKMTTQPTNVTFQATVPWLNLKNNIIEDDISVRLSNRHETLVIIVSAAESQAYYDFNDH